MKYYMTRVQFESVNDQTGKIQKIKENYLVEATSVTHADEMLKEKLGEGMSEFSVIKVDESNIMGIIK